MSPQIMAKVGALLFHLLPDLGKGWRLGGVGWGAHLIGPECSEKFTMQGYHAGQVSVNTHTGEPVSTTRQTVPKKQHC